MVSTMELETELLSDWGNLSENSRDKNGAGVQISTAVVETTEREVK